jgi:hypothetical protein
MRQMTTFERVAVELDRDMTDLLQNETTVLKGEGHQVCVQIVSASEGDQSRR